MTHTMTEKMFDLVEKIAITAAENKALKAEKERLLSEIDYLRNILSQVAVTFNKTGNGQEVDA